MKKLVLACSTALVVIGVLHALAGGLILYTSRSGERMYSDSLLSTGSDDSGLMQLGFYSFVVSALTALVALVRKAPERRVRWVYLSNVLFLAFVAFLVNLDTSIPGSIQEGDFLVLAGLVVALVPLPACLRGWAPG